LPVVVDPSPKFQAYDAVPEVQDDGLLNGRVESKSTVCENWSESPWKLAVAVAEAGWTKAARINTVDAAVKNHEAGLICELLFEMRGRDLRLSLVNHILV
jgi:hypothetical protein